MRFKLTSVAMGNDPDSIFTLDNNHRLWIKQADGWVNDANARAKQISVGNANMLWCVNPDGEIFSGHSADGAGYAWTENSLPDNGRATKVSAGLDGEVWALDENGHIWRRESNGNWSKDATAQDVVDLGVGSVDHVCCVNKEGSVFKRIGTSWEEISDNNTDVRDLAVSSDGFICYVAQNFDLRIYDNGGFDPEGTGRGLSVSAANGNEICIVNDDAELWHCSDEEWDELDGPDFSLAQVYFVQDGDTLTQIAEGLGIDFATLVSANSQIADPAVIQPGERVNIPA